MTLEVLAGLSGTSSAFLSMVENGKRPLERRSTLLNISEALKISPTQLAPSLAGASTSDVRTDGQKMGDSSTHQSVNVGERIAELRHDHGLTQEELADRASISLETVRKLEQQVRNPSMKMLPKLAGALGIGISDLLTYCGSSGSYADDRKMTPRQKKQNLREQMRFSGRSQREIVAAFASAYDLRPRSAWRESYGWSQTEAARRINAYRGASGIDAVGIAGLTGSHLCEYEAWPGLDEATTSVRKPSIQLLAVMATVYGCEIRDLLDFRDRTRLPPADLLIVDMRVTGSYESALNDDSEDHPSTAPSTHDPQSDPESEMIRPAHQTPSCAEYERLNDKKQGLSSLTQCGARHLS